MDRFRSLARKLVEAAALLFKSALLMVRRPQQRRASAAHHDALAAARSAVDGGRLKEAWALYRQLPASPAMFPELYDLACALSSHGAPDEAAGHLAEGRRLYARLSEHLPPSAAAKLAAELSGAPRKALYGGD